MSLEQLKAFLEKVKGDSSLQEKLKAAKSPEDVVGIAKEHGHDNWAMVEMPEFVRQVDDTRYGMAEQ